MYQLDPVLADVARVIRARACKVDERGNAAGHAMDGRALFVLLTDSAPRHSAGPVEIRPLLVVYETGTSRILHQLAGAEQVAAVFD